MEKLPSYFPLTLLLIMLSGLPALSQTEINGTIKDAETGTPLSYVNIGIKGGNKGTISQADGTFSLSVPEPLLHYDSLAFNAMGYKEMSFFIPDLFEEPMEILLQPAPIPMQEIGAVSGRWKEKTLGVKTGFPVLHGIATSREGDVLEIAQSIKVRKKPMHLLQARLYLNSAVGDSCTFRVKLYSDADGQPGHLLAAKNILIRQEAGKGWITAELKDFGLVMKDDFFISFEFIPETSDQAINLVYGGQLGKGRGYSRSSSLGEWEKAPCSYAIQALVAVQSSK